MTSLPHKGIITDIRDTEDGTRILTVTTAKRVAYLAGQYVALSFGGLSPRPFSIASMPDMPFFEFHIRNSGAGEVAAALPLLKTGDSVHIGIPEGNCHWRKSTRPLLAIAGGTGIAPMKPILLTHMADTSAPPARLYWGARSKSHLYLDPFFRALEKAEKRFHYSPVLSEEERDAPYRHGFINDALREDFPSLDHMSIYLAGPPMMVQGLYPLLLSMDADPAYIFGDGLPAAG